MRCLVTGATGHVGSYLTRALLARGCEVAVLVRSESNLWRIADVFNQVTAITGALGDLAQARRTLTAWQPETVFHLAWSGVTGAYRNDPAQITRNVAGSLELFEAAQAAGMTTWVGVGSQAEYGTVSGMLREDLPPRPETAYGVAKHCLALMTEKLCAMTETRFLWLRLLAAYGPMDDPHHLLPGVIEQLLDGKQPALTLGEQQWDYLYVEDAADAICRLALETKASGVFNLGAGHARSVKSLVEMIRDLIDPALPLRFGDVPYRLDQVMHLEADISKITRATGWQPQTPLPEGLRRTLDWHRSRRDPERTL